MDEITEIANRAYYLLSGLNSIASRDTINGDIYNWCNELFRPQIDELLNDLLEKNCEITYNESDYGRLLPIIKFQDERVDCTINNLQTHMSEQAILDKFKNR